MHKFGGPWTQDKLDRLEKYLKAYRTIFTSNAKARYFTTWYVDAFAGTGARIPTKPNKRPDTKPGPLMGSFAEDVYQDAETAEYLDGSARIALSLEDPFQNYLFIDKDKSHVGELKETIQKDYPALLPRCTFEQGDANEVLVRWCRQRNWKKERAVVFLDPYGMQVKWSTVETLAATGGVDLWYLFPLGVGVARLLTHDGHMEEGWRKSLDAIFGTPDWLDRFYEPQSTMNLFGEEENTLERKASFEQISAFLHERLSKIFVKVAKARPLYNSKKNPLYLLCFAASAERGADAAIRIAQDVLKD